jgi:hypothetical protein
MDLFKELVEFLVSVINSWAGYATGGVLVAALWLWSTIRNQPVPRNVAIGLAFLFLFAAFFNAWRTQRHKVVSLNSQIELLSKPNFEISQGSFITCNVQLRLANGEIKTFPSVFATISILNHGANSVAIDWQMIGNFPDGTKMAGKAYSPPSNLDFNFGGGPISFSPDQSLFKRGMASPTTTGALSGGYVLFLFDIDPGRNLQAVGTTFDLSVKDSTHHEYHSELRSSGDNNAGDMTVPYAN